MKLLPKFVLSLILLGAVLAATISYFSYYNSRDYLEDMYADRVVNGSKTIAKMLPLEDVRAILADGGEETEAYRRTLALLNELKREGGITYLSLVTFDEDSVTFYIDACVPEMGDAPANQIPYGADILFTDAAADEADLQNYFEGWRLYSQNTGTAAPMITDNSYGYNYTGEWPVLDENGRAVAEIQYILDMRGVREQMNGYLRSMLLISLVDVVVLLVCYAVFVRKTVVAPIGKLEKFTNDITASGNFHGQSISLPTGDEIEHLGNSFNFMLEKLEDYIENLAKVTAEKERIGAELDVAAHIQASMLPCIFPPFPERKEFEIYATMDPAKEVGGDFYDFFLVDADHLAFVMADVSGKSVPAALFMVIAKTLLKDHAQTGIEPKEVFTRVNALLCESNEGGLFVTVWMGVLELSSGKLTYVNAGHNPPLLRQGDGPFQYLRTRSGFVLAGLEGSRYRQAELTLAPGDAIYLYTDGVTEAIDAREELYGEERLEAVLNRCPDCAPEQLLPAVKADLDAYVKDTPQADDITMLALRYLGAQDAAPRA